MDDNKGEEMEPKYYLNLKPLLERIKLRFLEAMKMRKERFKHKGGNMNHDFTCAHVKELVSLDIDSYTLEIKCFNGVDLKTHLEKLILKRLLFRLNAPTPNVFITSFSRLVNGMLRLVSDISLLVGN
ncbi:hypothetical protein C5167_034225 [Papaver somniferum]|uniref:Uncharacterized protein n=1 Tax=Papaver somniferum TaxID=3469 RepID=A0A4Y7KDY0_PAPSO|nr:hypothetical protein C5167_034225 [Papaver somniferum]